MAKRRVLIVDDFVMNRDILKQILSGDYEILEADDGTSALKILNREADTISAVVLDLVMPRADGYDVLTQMRGTKKLAQIPVIVATGSIDEISEVQALTLGANDYITKPYNPSIIKNRLRNTINLRETAAMLNAVKIDALTGLYTRVAFFEEVETKIAKQKPGYYVMSCFDIDRFKVINDQYGNDKGNEVLKYIAKVFQEGFDAMDGICARITADNYAILYPARYKDTEEVKEIRRKASVQDGTILPLSFSVGRYIVDDLSITPRAMYDRAYMAKASIKGRFDAHIAQYSEIMRETIFKQQEIISEMNEALEKRQFEVWLQPQYNRFTGALIGAEALVRWRHPERGLIPPGEFIPLFERNGFIYELDKYIWEQTCVLLRRWMTEGREMIPISVNISRYDILRQDIVDVITGLVKKYTIPIDWLRLEITESAFAIDDSAIIGIVTQLSDLGFVIEIDDFGSGYSSLNTLKDVPANVVKLDMKFIEGDNISTRGGNIIESVIRMTKWLGMTVIAEGVETIEQADFLKSIGCNYHQGYLYAKPMSIEDFENLAIEENKEQKLQVLEALATLDNNAFWDPKSIDTLIFNSYVGGAFIFEYYHGKIDILRVNDRYVQIFGGKGMSSEGALNMIWGNYIDEESKQRAVSVIQSAIDTGKEVTDEMRLIGLRGPGKATYLRTTMRVIARTDERYLFYSMIDDLTAQRQAEQKEMEMSSNLRAIMKNINGGVSAVTIGIGNTVEYLFSNEQYYAQLGYTREQFRQEVASPFELVHPQERNLVIQKTARASIERVPCSVTYRVIRRDGTIAWIQSNITIADFPGIKEPVQISVANDITAQRQAEQKEKEINDQLRILNKSMNDLMNNTPGGFVRMHVCGDGQIRVEYINNGYCTLLGMTEEEIMENSRDNALWGIHPEDVEDVRELVSRMLSIHGNHSIKLRIRHKNGEYIPCMVFGRVVTGENNDKYINVYYTDNSQQDHLEKQRMELLENLPCGAGIYDFYQGEITLTYVNKRYKELVGRDIDVQDENNSASRVVRPGDWEHLMKTIREAGAHYQRAECDVHILHGDGTYKPFHVVGSFIRQKGGRINIYTTYTPISEGELSYKEMLPIVLSTMMSASTDYIFVKDKNLDYMCCSHAFAELIGMQDEKEVVGKTNHDLFSAEFADRYQLDDKKMLEDGKSLIDHVETIPSTDGTPRYSSTSKYIMKDSEQNIIGIYGIGHDITENREAYARLKLLTDNIPGGIVMYLIKDDEIRTIYNSEVVNEMTEYSKEEYGTLSNSCPLNIVVEEDVAIVKGAIARLCKDGTLIDCIYRIRTKSGKIKWINMRGTLADQENNDTIINAVLFDVTEQKNAEQKLENLEKENRLRYEHELQLRHELIRDSFSYFQLNVTQEIVEEYYTRSDDITGIRNGVKVNQELEDNVICNITPEYKEKICNTCFIEPLRKLYADGKNNLSFIYRRKIVNQGLRWMKMNISIMERPNTGDLIAFIHCHDIDSKKKDQMAVETIMDEEIESVVVIHVKTGIARFAQISVEYEGVKRQEQFDFNREFERLNMANTIRVDQEKCSKFFNTENLVNALAEEPIVKITYRVRGVDSVHRKTSRAFYLDDTKEEIILIRRDITSLYEEEQRQKHVLQNAIKTANAANKAKSDFLSNMSHDVRTPLNAVLSYSSTEMLEDANEQQLRDYMEKIHISGDYLLGIINDVLDMSKIEQNKIILRPEPYSLEEFRNTIDNIIKELSKNKEIQFFFNTKGVNVARFVADKVRLNQIFINLLSNAVKFTPRGGKVEFILKQMEQRDENTQVIQFTIRDNGIGMSKEFVPHAFESFKQEYREDVVEKNQGTGLGLSIVKELTEMMGGSIELQSEMNQGTTFTVYIPLTVLKMPIGEEKNEDLKEKSLAGLQILLCEDNDINTEIALALLEKKECRVDCAVNGKEGLEKYQNSEEDFYDIVLMDIRMPVMNGLEAARAIRKTDRKDAKSIPIVAMTADAFTEDEQIAHTAGMNAHLPKPINSGLLYKLLGELATKKHGG